MSVSASSGVLDRPWWVRLHGLTGIVPLAAYGVFHAWETAAGIGGREAFAARVTGLDGSVLVLVLEGVLVLLPLSVHAALGLVRVFRGWGRGELGAYRSRGSRRLQWITGIGALAFVGLHLLHTWLPKLSGVGAFGVYESLRTHLGTPFHSIAYVVGLTCVSFHLAQGISASLIGPGRLERARAVVWARVAGGVVGVALWAVSMNTLSHFVTGEAMFPSTDAGHESPDIDLP